DVDQGRWRWRVRDLTLLQSSQRNPSITVQLSIRPNSPPLQSVTIRAGGNDEGGTRGSPCHGFFPEEPQIVLEVQGSTPSIQITAHSSSDTLLAIRLPNGTFFCDDDGGGGVNPAITLNSAMGRYEVFVGTFQREDQGTPATVFVRKR
ncbi:MAG: hypothetical protein N2515_05925, partial [Deltaproteobacteria bacterium]|nr:hypothetical protein [Deltaproteobacteria bacterium]